MVDGFFERMFRDPLFGWARLAVPIHFVEPPEDFNRMAVGVAKLDRHLRARASPAMKIDRHAVLLQVVSRAKYLVDRRNLERKMMQFALRRDFAALANQTQGAYSVGLATALVRRKTTAESVPPPAARPAASSPKAAPHMRGGA